MNPASVVVAGVAVVALVVVVVLVVRFVRRTIVGASAQLGSSRRRID